MMAAAIELLFILLGVLGATGVSGMIPLWNALLFPIPALALVLMRKQTGWGG